jgi:hypothetical protein
LEGELDSAEIELNHLESKLEAIDLKLASIKKGKGREATDYLKQSSDLESKRDDTRARITKATKDLAILRMMDATVYGVLQQVVSSDRTSSTNGDVPI